VRYLCPGQIENITRSAEVYFQNYLVLKIDEMLACMNFYGFQKETSATSVVPMFFQCLHEAKQRKADLAIDIVICDTAGRLHTAYALMEELQACKEAIGAALPGQPAETLLVLDGTTGATGCLLAILHNWTFDKK
jgi:signal recognition particle GTPase